MKKLIIILFVILALLLFKLNQTKETAIPNIPQEHPKIEEVRIKQGNYPKILNIPLPQGYTRIEMHPNSFGDYLQNLSLRQNDNTVYLYDKSPKSNQSAHFAVVNLTIDNLNLEQCADALIRLRADYLYSQKKYDQIKFHLTNGELIDYTSFTHNSRPSIDKNNRVVWQLSPLSILDLSYPTYRKFLQFIFTYAGTLSLNKELKTIPDLKDLQIGDIFINAGSPGHAIIVVDLATDLSGNKIFLLAQSYMPAQEIEILVNPNDSTISPWYDLSKINDELVTPEWTFNPVTIKRFN